MDASGLSGSKEEEVEVACEIHIKHTPTETLGG